ncbi:cell cycle checkpoint control protein RAD9A isoform X1 [Grus americana]|uniref:cell cycle checkpoint control protein RAD9A isoform X1 n=1 Tax=Grus americana TaxID=9117 RepID=UPI0024082DC6|nr:cell cycle checkpoint control protein RAD9A isoform X1 [Grus americana]XP_054684316.1 cell cycle checkpoint control protein RAD9A isoform X1 [Grus americana]
MKCIITGGNVKVLGRAVHSLSRIGDELYLEPTESGLSLRAVNSSRSAFASFLFAPLFFQLYETGGAQPDRELLRCKVLMKSFLGVFRSLPSLEKTVGRCLILLKPRASRLVVQLHCKYGVTKTHNLTFQECERLQAIFDTQCCASSLCAPARVLAEAVVHFPQTLAEVTLEAGPGGKISLRNYVEDEAEPSKTMVTELWLAEDEFQAVAVVPGSRITFCLKEFRGLLTFAEASNLPLTIHYDAPGRPVIFTLDDAVLEVHLVLATLSDPESDLQPPAANGVSHLPGPSDDFGDDLESYMIAMETSAYEGGSGVPPSPTFPLRTPGPAKSDPEEEEEEEEGAVPGTPPHKKFRSLFFGSVLTPGGPSLAPTQEVLAEDSDGEY